MKCFLIAKKLSHSFSKPIHNELADYSYDYKELEESELDDFFSKKDFDGLNVTIPYKTAVMKYLDYISPEAEKIGAVNTVLKKDSALYGYNTDYYGFCYLLKEVGAELCGKDVVIIGRGGAAKTVKCVCEDMGAKTVRFLTREIIATKKIEPFLSAQILVNATPVGMYPDNLNAPIDITLFKECEAFLDLIYNPACTKMILDAQKTGIKTVNGLGMLVAQAKKAAEIFCGKSIADEEIERIKEKIEKQTKNIVLVGMPGCGKSSVGKEAAKILKRDFYDCDEEIEKEGDAPADIIKKHGEEFFRKKETAVLKELCKKQSAVIATGGGCVTRKENFDIIRQNSTVVFIKRDTKDLETEGRPLSQGGFEHLKKMSEERLPLYEKAADKEICAGENPQRTAEAIIDVLKMNKG